MEKLVSLAVSVMTLLIFTAYLQIRNTRKAVLRQSLLRHFMNDFSRVEIPNIRKVKEKKVLLTSSPKRIRRIAHLDEVLQSSKFNLSLVRWMYLFGFFSLALTSFLLIVGVNIVVSIVLSLLISLLLFRSRLTSIENRRMRSFQRDLPDFLTILASSLRSGLPLFQSIDSISKNGDAELYRQMRRASSEMMVGVRPEKALTDLAERMKSEEMKFVVIGLTIQRETGGNLAEVLDSVVETLRGREAIIREVDSLSAESRLSAWLLVFLPILVFIFFFFTRRDYVQVLWTTMIGSILLVFTSILMVLGTFWIRKIVKIQA